MFRFGAWTAVLLAVLVLGTQEVKAGIGFQPVSQEELKMTSEPLAPGAPAIILYRQVDRDDNLRTPHEDVYLRIKILTEEGRKYANVEIPFNKQTEEIVNLHARTIRPDGSSVELGHEVLEKELRESRQEGRHVQYLAKVFSLTDVQAGSIIEYSYTRDFHEYTIFDSHWFLSEPLFTRRAQFSLKPSPTYSLRWSWNNLPPGTDSPKQAPDNVVRMEANNIPAFQTEDHMPPPNELKSRVDFIYEGANASRDETEYWRNFGKKRNDQLEEFAGKRKAMEQAVAQIISPNDSPGAKLRKIYDRVQLMRNTSYEPRRTMQEEKREKEKVENVEEMWKRGYGGRMQLNWLFLALARAGGFEAYGCWVADRKNYFFTPKTMQASKLDATVVLVNLDGKDLYLSPGTAFAPFGLLAWWETGVPGLRLDKEGGTWIRTALPQASESRIERLGRMKLSSAGDLEGSITVTYIGQDALDQRVETRNADEAARKKFLERSLTLLVGVPAEAELTNKPDWNDSEAPLVAEFKLKVPNWASSTGTRLIMPTLVFTAGSKRLFERGNRVHPIYFDYSHERHDDVTIELPPGWAAATLPAPQTTDAKVLTYSLKLEQSPGSVRLKRDLTINVLLLDQKYYSAVRNFFETVRTSDSGQIVLQQIGTQASR